MISLLKQPSSQILKLGFSIDFLRVSEQTNKGKKKFKKENLRTQKTYLVSLNCTGWFPRHGFSDCMREKERDRAWKEWGQKIMYKRIQEAKGIYENLL